MRWAAVGAAIAVAIGAGGVGVSRAGIGSGDRSVFVPIEPCRLLDTRPATQVGPVAEPLGAGATLDVKVTGSSGDCSAVPADATAVAMNVAAIAGSARSFLTLFPAGTSQPNTANVNWAAGAPPTPNKVDVKLGSAGQVTMFNAFGSVHVAVDVFGYYIDHNHDDRYYTKGEVDAAVSAAVDDAVTQAVDELTGPRVPHGVVTLVAGRSSGSNDGLGRGAEFDAPYGLAVADDGTIYVADTFGRKIRRVTPDGVVTTLAGSSTGGFADGVGADAQFSVPFAVAIGPDENLYVADGHLVRRVTLDGVVTTLAGQPDIAGGDGYVDGPAATALFGDLLGIALADDGTIFLADTGNNRIRQLSTGGIVSTIAGTGVVGTSDGPALTAEFDGPRGMVLGDDGSLFISDWGNDRIRQLSSDGVVGTLTGTIEGFVDGDASTARFNEPWGITASPDGYLYVVDSQWRVRRVSLQGDVTTVVAQLGSGNLIGVGEVINFLNVRGIAAAPDGTLYVLERDELYRIT